MKGKILFGAGIATGYVLGARSGRAAYERLKTGAAALWQSKPVQDGVAAATEAVKDKAPEVTDQLTEAARRAGTVISSAVHRNATAAGQHAGKETAVPVVPDIDSDPARTDADGQDWSDEGGATPAGAATNVDPDKVS